MKSVLLTGASGCIGSYASRILLDRGYEVHAVSSRPQPSSSEKRLIWHVADLTDRAQAAELAESVKASHLLHLAWYMESDVHSAEENHEWVRSSLELYQGFWANGGSRAVCAGSCSEYQPTDSPSVEGETPLGSETVYGQSKLEWHRSFQIHNEKLNLNAAWAHVFFLYGPGERPNRLVPSVIRALLDGKRALVSHGDQTRDYLFVEDVARGFCALLESDVLGPVNIGSGVPVSLKQVALTIGDIIGRPELIEFGAIPPRGNEPPFLVADTRRMREDVGFAPRFDLRSGIETTIDWWREGSPNSQHV